MTSLKSNFLGGDGGWTVVDGAAFFGWEDDSLKKGGYIAATDAGSGLWGFVGPASWTGDLSANFGGKISYSLRLASGGAAFRETDITITAGDGSVLTYSFDRLATSEWTRFSVTLDPYSGWRNSAGSIASEAEMLAVLKDVASFRIRGDQVVGLDTTQLDTVRFIEGQEKVGNDPAYVGPRLIQTDFMKGGEGWGFTGDLQSFQLVKKGGANLDTSQRSSPALDRAYLEAVDQAAGDLIYMTAPAEYLGHKTNFYGGLLRYKMKINDTSLPINGADDIVITGANGTSLVYQFPFNPGTGWTDFQVRLHEFAHWKVGTYDGPEATEDDIRGVLSDIASLVLRGEFREGAEMVGIDAVELRAGKIRCDVYDNSTDRNLLASMDSIETGLVFIGAELAGKEPPDSLLITVDARTHLDKLWIDIDNLHLISDPRALSGAIKMKGGAHNITIEDCGDLTVTGTRTSDTIVVTSPRAVELRIEGGAGHDTLKGIAGKRGHVTLDGGNGNDTLLGGEGPDLLKGGDGLDILHGFGGYDKMSGGANADVFIHETGDGRDIILDFKSGVDRINLVHAGVASFDDLHFIDGRAGGLIIRFGNGDDLQLKGIATADELSPDDFLFGTFPPPSDGLLI